jgi:predicted alpha/beta superfamily hydrolase
MKKLSQILLCPCLFLLFNSNVSGQEKQDSLYSTVLKEERYIQVYLPENYKNDKKYDVLYVLDGEMLSRFVAPIISFEQENELMPQVIIIGIKNNYWYNINQDSRERDLLPKLVEASPLSGGADSFIWFLKTELLPFINGKYSSGGKNILFGHSYGGLFTAYTFLTQPEIFDSYIASDPALWWNDGFVNKLAKKTLQNTTSETKTFFIGGRDGGIYEAFGIKEFETFLKNSLNKNLRWQVMANSDEHHGSVRLKNIYEGLKFTYFGYSSFMVDFFPMEGILIKNKPVPIFLYSTYLKFNPGIRYTTNGSEPTANSPRFDYGIKVSAPAIFTLKQFSNFGADKIMKGKFILGNMFASVKKPANLDSGGFHFAYYECDSNKVSIINNKNAIQQGVMNSNFNVNNFSSKMPFACIVEGFLKTAKEGYYTFFMEADYLAKLYIDDKLLNVIDISFDKLNNKSFVLPLAKGFHQIKIEYFHKTGDRNFSISYLPPSSSESQKLAHLPINIPLDIQYRTNLN